MSDDPSLRTLTPAQQRRNRLALRLLAPLAVALAIIVIPLYLIYDVSRVDGPSMLPTLRDGDYLLISRGLDEPARGDVVVIDVTYDDGTRAEIVKRLVALGGDAVSVRGDQATIDGKPEAFAHAGFYSPADRPASELVLPKGYMYVMGDNRPLSSDSRTIGALPVSDIHGKVLAVWFPLWRIRLIPSP